MGKYFKRYLNPFIINVFNKYNLTGLTKTIVLSAKTKTTVSSPIYSGFFFKSLNVGGERGIRTPGTVAGTTVFKTAAFDRSAISPGAKLHFFLISPIFCFYFVKHQQSIAF
jgi:hypothetical protein